MSVRTEVVVDDDAVGQGVFQVDHGLERLVSDVDQLERVARRGITRGEHTGDAVADVARLARGERVMRRILHVLRDRPRAGHRCRPCISQVRAGVHGDDAVGTCGAARVDRRDPGVRIRTAQHGEVQCPGDVEIVGKASLAREQGGILAAKHPRAEHARRGGGFRSSHVRTPRCDVSAVGASQDGSDDVVVAGAPAEVSFEADAYLGFAG
jgi:hypothetical protein